MDRRARALIGHLIIPFLAGLVFLVRGCYWLFYGWWGEKRYNAKEQEKLQKQVVSQFLFLFQDHNARIVPNHIENPMLTGWPVVTVTAEDLLVCFIEWRDERRVLTASERLPMRNPHWRQRSLVFFATIFNSDTHAYRLKMLRVRLEE